MQNVMIATPYGRSGFAGRLKEAVSKGIKDNKELVVGMALGAVIDVVAFASSLADAMRDTGAAPWVIAIAAAAMYVLGAHAAGGQWSRFFKLGAMKKRLAEDASGWGQYAAKSRVTAAILAVISTVIVLAVPIGITVVRFMAMQAKALADADFAAAQEALGQTVNSATASGDSLTIIIFSILMVSSALMGLMVGFRSTTEASIEAEINSLQQVADEEAFTEVFHQHLDEDRLHEIDQDIQHTQGEISETLVRIAEISFQFEALEDAGQARPALAALHEVCPSLNELIAANAA